MSFGGILAIHVSLGHLDIFLVKFLIRVNDKNMSKANTKKMRHKVITMKNKKWLNNFIMYV